MTDLKHYETIRNIAGELIHIHKNLDFKLGQDSDVEFILYDTKIVLTFHDLKVLSKLRKAMKSIYPKWQDKITQVWQGCNCMITSWTSTKHSLVEFWFECSADKYPESLMKPGCEIITQSHEESRSVMVCKI